MHRALRLASVARHLCRVSISVAPRASLPRLASAAALLSRSLPQRRRMSSAAAAAESSPDSAPAAATDAVAPAAADPAAVFPHHHCRLIGLAGWDSGVKIERRLLAAGIRFLGVDKKRGDREVTAEVYFADEQTMREEIAKMETMRAEPQKEQMQKFEAAKHKRKAEEALDTAAAAAGAAASADAKPAPPPPQGRQLFKPRFPLTTLHPAPWTRPAEVGAAPGDAAHRGGERSEFKPRTERGGGGKRARVEVNEGEIGYVPPTPSPTAAAEGEANEAMPDAPAASSSSDSAAAAASSGRPSSPRPRSPSGRTSPSQEVEANVNDVVAPLWRKPYAEQLRLKRAEVLTLMKDTTRKWKREYGSTLQLPTEVKADPTAHEASKATLFCPLDEIVGSAVTEAYRNKCEFSIGRDSAGAVATGFQMGKFTEGEVRVEHVDSVPFVPTIAKSIVRTFNTFAALMASKDKAWGPYDKRDHSGFWRMMCVRNSQETKQVMMLIQVDPKARTAEQMAELRAELLAYFKREIIEDPSWSPRNDGYSLRAIQFQCYSGVSNAAPEHTPIELLYGESASITEHLMGLQFRVSQQAFFQINVQQTAVLYKLAADLAQLPAVDATPAEKSRHVLLDVCCGTGTIGLSLANRVGKVVGLEMSAAATDDAKFNAKLNGITNAHYYVGKAEDTLGTALAEHVNVVPPGLSQAAAAAALAASDMEVTAILDPPRSGVHADVLRLLRRCPKINRIVYVSCNPRSLMDNLQRLVQPASKTYAGVAFVAKRAVPVDMFPHANVEHCEMVVLLEREKPKPSPAARWKQPTKQFAHQMKQPQPQTQNSSSSSTGTEATAPASSSDSAAAPTAAPPAAAASATEAAISESPASS